MPEQTVTYEQLVLGDAVPVHVHRWQSATPSPLQDVLFVHGLGPQSGLNAADFAERLCAAGGYRVTAPDLPGFGATPELPADRYTASSVAGLLAEAVMAETTAPVHIVAHSWGAEVGCQLAAQRTRAVRSLGLLDGGHEDWPEIDRDAALAAAQAFADQCKFPSVDAALAEVRAELTGWSENVERAYRGSLVTRDGAVTVRQLPETYAAIRTLSGLNPVSASWPAIQDVPTLLILPTDGTADPPGDRAARLSQVLRRLTVTTIGGTTHLMPDDAGLRLAEIFLDWWAGAEADI